MLGPGRQLAIVIALAVLAGLGAGAAAGAQSLPQLPALPGGGAPQGGDGSATTSPPAGCTPTPLTAVAPSAAQLCVDQVLVTQDTDAHEQNDSVFIVTDHRTTMTARVPNWWPSGGPVAGMVVTLWGHMKGTTFAVDRWIDRTHGTGPAPDGPYPVVSALDVASGKVPEHRMVWIPTYPFLLDPQQAPLGGDGDIHVQTANGCPAGGVTTENTPPLRGYVDHPALPGQTSSTDPTDQPSNHLADAPPVGVPVMILGAARYDYGFGWWELHPIRAWRFLTVAEAQLLASQCGSAAVPQVDKSGPLPVPFGFPPCTDGSEIGTPPGYGGCHSQCFVTKTVIGQPEQLAGPCTGIKPVVTPDQESLPQTDANSTPATPSASGGGAHGGTGAAAPGNPAGGTGKAGGGVGPQASRRLTLAALARTYGRTCRALKRGHRSSHAYRECLLAMARLAGSETRSPASACRNESRRRRRGGSDYSRCVAAGRTLLRALAPSRIVEG